MGNSARAAAIFAAVGVAVLCSGFVSVRDTDDWKSCADHSSSNYGKRETACTRIIETKNIAPRDLADALTMRGRYDDLKLAAEAEPQNPARWHAMVDGADTMFVSLGSDDLLEAYDHLIPMTPNDANLYVGRIFARSGNMLSNVPFFSKRTKDEEDLLKALQLDANNVGALKVCVNLHKENPAWSLPCLKRLIAVDPQNEYRYRYFLGRENPDPEASVVDLTRALELQAKLPPAKPEDDESSGGDTVGAADILQLRAGNNLEAGHLDAAIADYQQAIALTPEELRDGPRELLADLYEAHGRYKEALDVRTTMTVGDWALLRGRALDEVGLHNWRSAVADFTKALAAEKVAAAEYKVSKDNAPSADNLQATMLLERADAYSREGWRTKAAEDRIAALRAILIDKAAGLDDPHTAKDYVSRGTRFLNAAMPEYAIADFQAALKLDPKVELPHAKMGEFISDNASSGMSRTDWKQAQGMVDVLMSSGYQSVGLLFYDAILHSLRGEHDKALAELDFVISHKPSWLAGAFFQRGNADLRKGDNQAAVADYTQAIALAADDPEAQSRYLYQRAKAKRHLHDDQGADADIAKSLQLDKKDIAGAWGDLWTGTKMPPPYNWPLREAAN